MAKLKAMGFFEKPAKRTAARDPDPVLDELLRECEEESEDASPGMPGVSVSHNGSQTTDTTQAPRKDDAVAATSLEEETPENTAPCATHRQYSFPEEVSGSTYAGLADAQLIARLEDLLDRHYDDKLRSYSAIRGEFCALSIEMNIRMLMAPRLRPQPKFPWKASDRKASDELVSNDRQVIDLHWLKCRGFENSKLRAPYKKLFSDALFDFDLASDFVTKTGRVSVKAEEILELTRQEQLELAVIQSDSVRREFANLMTGFTDPKSGKRTPARRIAISQRIKTAARKNPRIRNHVQTYEALWLARELVESHSPTQVREWLGLITGTKPPSRKTIEGKLQTLGRILEEITPPS